MIWGLFKKMRTGLKNAVRTTGAGLDAAGGAVQSTMNEVAKQGGKVKARGRIARDANELKETKAGAKTITYFRDDQ